MKTLATFALVGLLSSIAGCSSSMQAGDPPAARKLRHVVAFRFKPEVTTEQMEKVSADFAALEGKVPQIIEFEGGPDINFQRKREAESFTHSFMVTVADRADLAAYGSHPDHRAFSASADPLLEEVMVVDYWEE